MLMSEKSVGKILRLAHILRDDGRTLVVAMDHGMMGITEGIEEALNVVEKVIEGEADAILVNLGVARKVAETVKGKIAVVLTIPYDPKYVELAAKLGVDAVKTTYFGPIPLSEEKYNQFSAIGRACEEWGMPYIAEVVPVDEKGKTIYDVETVKKAARIGAELGGDMVKTAYTGTVEEYRSIVKACPVPIVVMGGPKMENDKDVLQMVKNSVDAGAAGGAIGRNIWQHKDPAKMAKAISKIIHDNITVEEALKILK
jgi:fructose-bisphosphate aldolase/2-amino-3,7-dideoxy-D-threo-hept-6-ulosonate synthase